MIGKATAQETVLDGPVRAERRARVRTAVPGPVSQRLLARQEQFESNARTYPRQLPLAIRRASGPYVEDVDGNVFIDFLTGAGVASLGHNHPDVVDAVKRQLDLHPHGLDFPTPVKDEFTAVQLSLLPEEMRARTKIHFCGPTGANAVEAALKLCKVFTGRSDVIAFHGAFHGSTHAAMSVSGSTWQKQVVANGMPGVHFLPFPYPFRAGGSPEDCARDCLRYFETTLRDSHSGVQLPAAVIMELVQGEGGVIPAPVEFAQGIRRITRELDVPLVIDEVQTGAGRTGTWFAFEQYGIVPDVVIASKALTGIGMPIALVLYDERMDVWQPGIHTGTFRGNQLAFAAGIATAQVFRRDRVFDTVREQGRRMRARLEELRSLYACVGDVRGLGLMLGGRGDTVVRLLPPLNLDAEVADEALDILEAALAIAGGGWHRDHRSGADERIDTGRDTHALPRS